MHSAWPVYQSSTWQISVTWSKTIRKPHGNVPRYADLPRCRAARVPDGALARFTRPVTGVAGWCCLARRRNAGRHVSAGGREASFGRPPPGRDRCRRGERRGRRVPGRAVARRRRRGSGQCPYRGQHGKVSTRSGSGRTAPCWQPGGIATGSATPAAGGTSSRWRRVPRTPLACGPTARSSARETMRVLSARSAPGPRSRFQEPEPDRCQPLGPVDGPLVAPLAQGDNHREQLAAALVDIHSALSWLARPGAYPSTKAARWSITPYCPVPGAGTRWRREVESRLVTTTPATTRMAPPHHSLPPRIMIRIPTGTK
jgi:hypothetical protein